MINIHDLNDAGRLIQWALHSNIHPNSEPEYRELIERYLNQPDFNSAVREILSGLGLRVLDVGLRGMILTAESGSIFEMTAANYVTSNDTDKRLLIGLIHIAILATVFPRPQDLIGDPAFVRPPIRVDQVNETLRQLCERQEEAARNQPDPTTEARVAGLDEAWRVYRRYATRDTSSKRHRGRARTMLAMIRHELEMLCQRGCFILIKRDGSYQSTWRYQIMAQEASPRVYEVVHNISTQSDR